MSREVKAGMTDYSVLVFIPDSASTDGSGKTGLVAANLTVSGARVETDNDVTVTDYTSSLNNLAALTTAHTDWGWLEVSSTLAPGLYRLDIADAIFASGAWSAVVYVMVTSSAAAATPMEFILVPQSPIDGVLLAPTTHTSAVIPTVTTLTGHTPQTGDSYARIGATGSGLTSLASQASVDTLDNFVDTEIADIQSRLPAALVGGRMDSSIGAAAANTITASALATDAVSEIQSGLALAADLATVAGYLDTEIAAILADTNELQTDWANGGRLDLILDARASQTSVDDVPTVAEFEARTPTAAQLAYIVANAATGLPVTFTTSGGSTMAAVLNQVDGAAASATNDQYNGRLLVFTDGTLKGVVTDITDYVGSTTTATITAIPFAPTSSHNARLI